METRLTGLTATVLAFSCTDLHSVVADDGAADAQQKHLWIAQRNGGRLHPQTFCLVDYFLPVRWLSRLFHTTTTFENSL